MRNGNQIFDILGIEPTSDRRIIKKAYAQKVKECHPEENPEEWKQLHNAYEAALKYVSSGRSSYYMSVDIPMERAERKVQNDNDYRVKETRLEKQKHKELEQKARETRKERELENLFQKMDTQNEEKKLQLQEEYGREINKLKECSKRQAFRQWRALFSHPDFWCYCQESKFWELLAQILETISVNKKTLNYISEKLNSIEEDIVSNVSQETAGKFRQVNNVCRAKKKYIALLGQEKKIKKKDFAWIAILIMVIVGVHAANKIVEQVNKVDVEEELIGYLDEKYGIDSYQSGEFYIEKVEIGSRYNSQGKAHTYIAEMKEDSEKKVFIWSYEKKGVGKQEVLCLDNFQQEEIKTALNQELQKSIEAESGILCLLTADSSKIRMWYGNENEEVAYHTLYEGNLKGFFEKEKQVREEWIADKQENNFDMLGELQKESYINGKCIFVFPDKAVLDIRQRLENPQCSYDNNFVQAIKSVENTYGIQVLAMAVPQSYYASMMQELEKDQCDAERMIQIIDWEAEEYVLANIPFATMWYRMKEVDVESLRETMSYESMLPPEAMQEAKKQLGVEDIQEEPKAECEEIHTVKTEKLEDGIYLMVLQEEAGFNSKKTVNYKDNEISITCSNEYPNYILILDMEKLGIEEDNYYVEFQENKGENNPEIYQEYPYTAIEKMYNAVWKGEGLLFIYNKYQYSSSSTYTVVLEKNSQK